MRCALGSVWCCGSTTSTAEQVPGLDLVDDDVWVSVGGDDAVMDVEGQVVKARSSHLVSLDTEPGDSPLETTLAALEQSP